MVAYFSGPIRSAGTTASCMVLMMIDYLRETFGFCKYDPSEDEIRRYVTENYDYHERITNLQYLPTEEEIVFLARNLPIQISGEPSEEREVSNYKGLHRIETDQIRGGMCLIFSEGLAQKAQKGFRLWKGVQAKGFDATGWEFLEEYITKFKKKSKGEGDNVPTYIKDLVAGRPVYGHPSRSGSFRFRYGRTKTSGFSAAAVHPATMAISDSFLSFGTQLKIEKPTKGCVVSVSDQIDGPIVKLKSGSVRKIDNLEDAKKIYKEVSEIIYLGDLLIPFGDVANRNYELLKSGYVEEWWELDVKKNSEDKEKIENKFKVDFDRAVNISKKYAVPLHPKYSYYWKEINYEYFLGLVDWISHLKISEGKVILPYSHSDRERFVRGKRALELIGCPHEVFLESVILDESNSRALLLNLGINSFDDLENKMNELFFKIKEEKPVLEMIKLICPFKIKDKSGSFIGARMGRPEKSKLRKLTGSPHALFPVGEEGGRLRSFQAAIENGKVNSDFPNYYCDNCKMDKIYPRCEKCNNFCRKITKQEEYSSGEMGKDYERKSIDIRYYFEDAKKKLGLKIDDLPAVIKGVRGTTNKDHSCEHLGKGILRARHNLNVNKDGTIRYDMTEMAITHFKPKEISVSVEKLRSLGYEKDIYGKELVNESQTLEIFPHDVILPSCPDSNDERADDVVFKITQFIDDEVEKLYGLERFFKIKKKDDVIGQYLVCIAPHICTATVGRIIGFSKTQTFLASPFMHAAMRRDCDGDEAAFMLLMDLLLNFSKKFLPAHRGGTQDSPLVLNVFTKTGDVDDQILFWDRTITL